MSIARWDPFFELKSLENRMGRLLDRSARPGEGAITSAFEFAPPADIYEDENKITVKMEVPGIRQEDLDIRINGNTLSVRGERKLEKDEKRENFRHVERQYGSFSRSFQFTCRGVPVGEQFGDFHRLPKPSVGNVTPDLTAASAGKEPRLPPADLRSGYRSGR